MGRLPIAKMLAATVVLTVVISAVMLPINWNGQGASTAAPKIDTLLDVMIVLSAFVFALVMVMLFGAGYSWAVLNDIEEPAPNPITVDVFSQQFAWSFGYPGKGNAYSEGELHVPLDRQVHFKMHALDVLHSFWVPEWRIKKDNVPGITTTAIVTPDKPGTYQLVCTELCGFGHAAMRAEVVVEPPGEFRKWVSGLKETIPQPYLETIKQDTETNPLPVGPGGA
jgi:cytochrome c oxidase subunit II